MIYSPSRLGLGVEKTDQALLAILIRPIQSFSNAKTELLNTYLSFKLKFKNPLKAPVAKLHVKIGVG